MEYGIDEERVGAPTYKVDEAKDELINTLAEFLKMERLIFLLISWDYTR